MILLESDDGQKLFQKSILNQTNIIILNKLRRGQLTNSSCSIATLSEIANTWYLTCNNLIDVNMDEKLPFDEIKFTEDFTKFTKTSHGMTFDMFMEFAVNQFANKLTIKTKRGDELNREEFIKDVLDSIESKGQTIIVLNYHLKSINPEWIDCGHFSPVSGFVDGDSPQILIADTYVHPYWSSVDNMISALKTIDVDCNKPRGYLIVHWNQPL